LDYFQPNSKTKNRFHVKPKPLESEQNYLKLSCLHQKLIQNKNVWKRRKNMKKVPATEQHASRVGLLAVADKLTRRSEQEASKHCSLSHIVRHGEQISRCGELW